MKCKSIHTVLVASSLYTGTFGKTNRNMEFTIHYVYESNCCHNNIALLIIKTLKFSKNENGLLITTECPINDETTDSFEKLEKLEQFLKQNKNELDKHEMTDEKRNFYLENLKTKNFTDQMLNYVYSKDDNLERNLIIVMENNLRREIQLSQLLFCSESTGENEVYSKKLQYTNLPQQWISDRKVSQGTLC